MKRYLLFLSICLVALAVRGQSPRQYSTYYYQRASLFRVLPVTSDDIVFVGSSITDGAEWYELFHDSRVKNRGISGDTTYGVYDRLDDILTGHPAQMFLMVGTNNIPLGESVDSIAAGVRRIIRKARRLSPRTQILLQSILPVTPHYVKFQGHTARWKMIPDINRALCEVAREEQVTYIDLFTSFADEAGQMRLSYTNDGLHLLGPGYLLWKSIVQPYLKKKDDE